jgi:agmatine deiminase
MKQTQTDTPSDLGFRMPAEWERHESTWLSWPKNPITFPSSVIERVEQTYLEMISALKKEERVDLLVDDQKTEERIASMLSSAKNVRFHHIKTADVWIRDYGPIFVRNTSSVAATKWTFNAWGKKYDDLLPDNDSGTEVCKRSRMRVFHPEMVLEGGSIDVNGLGTCLTTRQCLLNENRNPGMDGRQIESRLHDYLGIVNLVWLHQGIGGDDTDGHVDDIARFVDKSTVLCMTEGNASDENSLVLRKNYEELKMARDQDGKPLDLITLDMPGKIEISDARLPASYANFYIGNGVILVPTFGDRSDDAAISKLSELFPRSEILDINCKELVYGFGGIHCVTQQQPISPEKPV